MYSKQAEYLHAGVVVDMQKHHRDNYIILYTASDQKYSEWVHVNCDEVHNKLLRLYMQNRCVTVRHLTCSLAPAKDIPRA